MSDKLKIGMELRGNDKMTVRNDLSADMVVCNQAGNQPFCDGCPHSEKHEPERNYITRALCTEWGKCYGENEIKVRCVKGL